MKNLWHRGEAGDILYSWFLCAKLGEPVDYTCAPKNMHGNFDQFEALAPLAALQPYLHSFKCAHNWTFDQEDLRLWIDGGARTDAPNIVKPYFVGHNLAWPGYEPWITGVAPVQLINPYTVVNITHRYRDANFQWNAVLPAGQMLFIGLPDEFENFHHYLLHTGYKDAAKRLAYAPTKDFLEAARYILGAQAYFGNASACLALAQGLGVRDILGEFDGNTLHTCRFGHEKVLNVPQIA